MKFLKEHWFPLVLGIIIIAVVFNKTGFHSAEKYNSYNTVTQLQPKMWKAPQFSALGNSPADSLIRYGHDLFVNTAYYLGPKGKLATLTNGMSCQSCHEDAGTKNFSNCLSAVAAKYPKFRDRSGRVESISFRVNDCMERSLNGHPLDSISKEMLAIVAYIKWLGNEVPVNVRPDGAGTAELEYISRAASPAKGEIVFQSKCIKCHGANGEGQLQFDSTGYIYPPLWGKHSYNTSAGLFRLSRLAAFIKDNMPFGAVHANPQLTTDEAWDVAAFISNQSRPHKIYATDWKVISTKPVDYPFGPFADSFSSAQHKFGPFEPIVQAKKKTSAIQSRTKKLQ